MTEKVSTHVSEQKKKIVAELNNLLKSKKTILIASIKNIPGSQFQEITKKLRNKAIIKVPKKNLIFRAIDSCNNESIKKLENQIKESTAILFSDLDAFELSNELIKNKAPAKAKPGQEALEDIKVEEGPTELVPGPAISELGALGIKIKIESGKITITEPKIIVKQNEKISKSAAEIMSKLDIKPFSIGFMPLAAFDTKENKLYLDIKIDTEGTIKELKQAFSKALAFAVEISYISDDTISFLIRKAVRNKKALEKFAEVGTSGDKIDNDNKGAQDKKNNSKSGVETDKEGTDNQPKEDKQDNQKDRELTENKNPEPQGEANKENTQKTKSNQEENK